MEGLLGLRGTGVGDLSLLRLSGEAFSGEALLGLRLRRGGDALHVIKSGIRIIFI